MLGGAIKESRLARVRRGLIFIQKGEGGDKGGDSSLYSSWTLEVEERWRDEAGRVFREQWRLLAVDWGGLVASGVSCTGSAATATLPVHAGENLGVTKYERWERRQGSIEAPMATKPTLPDGMCLPTGKPA